MKISDKCDGIPERTDRAGQSFANELGDAPVAARAFAATDLATSFAWVVPSFVPAAGEEMIGAMAQGEGVVREMRRYEEQVDRDEDGIDRT